MDFNHDGIAELTMGLDAGFFGVQAEGATRYVIYEDPPPNIGGSIEPLSAGFEIGPAMGPAPIAWFDDGVDGPGAPFAPLVICLNTGCAGRFRGQLGYMGVEFELADGKHYGWVRLSVSEIVASGSVGGWAYETEPGVSILAGAIPEPSTILLFAGGAVALLLIRWRARAG